MDKGYFVTIPRLLNPSHSRARWLAVMAKEPRAGAVKTRLARDIGTSTALRFYRAALNNILRRLSQPRRWKTVLAVSPGTALASPVWPQGIAQMHQGTGDLGTRMQRVFSHMPPGPVVIIGTDIPEIRATHIAQAFRFLGSHDAVFGPAGDGGYWLVGLKRSPRTQKIFSHVRWSSAHTLRDTLLNLTGSRVAFLEELDDVDDGKSYRRLGPAGSRIVLPYKSS